MPAAILATGSRVSNLLVKASPVAFCLGQKTFGVAGEGVFDVAVEVQVPQLPLRHPAGAITPAASTASRIV